MMESVADTIWFAGEAAHETLWGTLGGAWESGERAAAAVLQRLGPLKATPVEAEAGPKTRAKPIAKPARAAPRQERSFSGTPSIMRDER
jgi:hypothetical protein